ncbi:hypothetical protein PoMZ_13542, partial [Pyricularia oryzae]
TTAEDLRLRRGKWKVNNCAVVNWGIGYQSRQTDLGFWTVGLKGAVTLPHPPNQEHCCAPGNSYTSARAGLGSGISFWRLRGVIIEWLMLNRTSVDYEIGFNLKRRLQWAEHYIEESSTVYLHLINFSAAVEKMITTDFDSEHNVRKLVNRDKEAVNLAKNVWSCNIPVSPPK